MSALSRRSLFALPLALPALAAAAVAAPKRFATGGIFGKAQLGVFGDATSESILPLRRGVGKVEETLTIEVDDTAVRDFGKLIDEIDAKLVRRITNNPEWRALLAGEHAPAAADPIDDDIDDREMGWEG